MDQQLKALLGQIYSAPSCPAIAASDSQPLSADDFRMYVYKVVPCTRRGPHSWVECSYCHPGEKAGRRCPQKYCYVPITCPDFKKGAHCPRGDDCMFAHNVFEYWLHPARYRTQLCSYGMECKRGICFFAHHPGEMRVHSASAQLSALEKELEATDPSFAAPNPNFGKPAERPQNQHHCGVTQQHQHRQAGRPQPQMGSPPDNLHAAAHIRQLQQALNGQLGSAALSQHAMLNAALGGYLPPQQQAQTPQRPVHASAAAAAAALLEAALQPSTPPVSHPVAVNPAGLSPCSSLLSTSSLSHQLGAEDSMAATMKLLADLSAAGQAMSQQAGASGAMRLQSVSSVPAPSLQQQQGGGSDVQQALHLIGQLQQLVGKASASPGSNGDLQSVLLNMLPQVLLQAGAQKPAEAPAAACDPVPLLCSYPSAPVPMSFWQQQSPLHPHARAVGSPPKVQIPPLRSLSPADALSDRSRRTAGSSCSSYLSDGCHSPPLSHHSDEGIRNHASSSLDGCSLGLGLMPSFRDNLEGCPAGAAGPAAAMATAGLGSLPLSIEPDEDLVSGMADMSGASAMIASLSQMVADCPRPTGKLQVTGSGSPAALDEQLQGFSLAAACGI